jgi:hypothetical protein
MLCGISCPFRQLSPATGQVSYVLRTRSPLRYIAAPPFDLHVLGTPPAFILSQDQTLRKFVSALQTTARLVAERRCLGSFFLSRDSLSYRAPVLLSARLLSFTMPLLRCAACSLRRQKTASAFATGFGRHFSWFAPSPDCCVFLAPSSADCPEFASLDAALLCLMQNSIPIGSQTCKAQLL